MKRIVRFFSLVALFLMSVIGFGNTVSQGGVDKNVVTPCSMGQAGFQIACSCGERSDGSCRPCPPACSVRG